MLSKLAHNITPNREASKPLTHKITPRKKLDVSDISNKVQMVDITSLKLSSENVELLVKEKRDLLEKAIEKTAQKKISKAHELKFKSKLKIQRNRVPFVELQKRYLHENYAAKLVHCKRLDDYDCGKRTVCVGKCGFNCQAHFLTNMATINNELNQWWGVGCSYSTQRTLLVEDISTNCTRKDDGTYEQRYFVAGKQVCRSFYMRARGIHNGTLFAVEKDVLSKSCSMLGGVLKDRKVSDKASNFKKNEVRSWILLFAKHVGDKAPNETVTVLPYRQVLPIWQEYVDDIEAGDGQFGKPCGLTHFRNIFNKVSVQHKIRLLRNTGSFVTCTICTAYHSRLRKVRSIEEREQLKQYRRDHLNKQRIQREKYYYHRSKAISYPDEYLCIIMDGMDQKKTNLPVLGRYTKDEAPLRLRLVGVKVHGKRNYAFLVDSTVPGGGNLMIEILRQVLNDLDEKNELPTKNPKFYLQVDNCGENKNKTLFAFLVDLVKRGVFNKIKVGFLMVGHTHEDIDSFFSTIAAKLKSGIVCPDFQSMVAAIQSAFDEPFDKPLVTFFNAIDIFDYTKLYEPVIDSTIAYHQHPHQFRIKRFDENTVLLHYKQWSHSKFWLPMPANISSQMAAQPTCTTKEVLNLPSSLPSSPTKSPKKKKQRKMTRWTTTCGQRLFITQERAIGKQTAAAHIPDIPEVELYNSDSEGGVFDAQSPDFNSMPGICWISKSPDLSNVAHITFKECTVLSNFDLAEKTIQDIQKKFAAVMPEFFTSEVMQQWNVWMLDQQKLWDPSFHERNRTICSPLKLPSLYRDRIQLLPVAEKVQIQDSAMDDEPETNEIILHSSGAHGSFDKFCPPKGAKPQKGTSRPDALYQDIRADMKFNQHYLSKRGKKIESEDCNLEKDVLLAFNLTLKKDGAFGSTRLREGKYNITSLGLVAHVIQMFYLEREAKKMCVSA